MKTAIFLCLLALAMADKSARTINYDFSMEEDGSYTAEHETSNGISASEEGISYPGNLPESGNYVRSGSYSYQWEGVTYTVTWTADENGYRAEGVHLPGSRSGRGHIGGQMSRSGREHIGGRRFQ